VDELHRLSLEHVPHIGGQGSHLPNFDATGPPTSAALNERGHPRAIQLAMVFGLHVATILPRLQNVLAELGAQG
jgi:hypothetical protein